MSKRLELDLQVINSLLPTDIKLKITDMNGIVNYIDTHKVLLAMYSKFFKAMFINKGFTKVGNEVALGNEVSDIKIMKKLINSFYEGNTIEMIEQAPCTERIELLMLCNFFMIDVPRLELLMKGTIDEDCQESFLDITGYYEEKMQNYLIAIKISKNVILSLDLEETVKEFFLDRLSYLVLVMEREVVIMDLALSKEVMKIDGEYGLAIYSRNKRVLMLSRNNTDYLFWDTSGSEPVKIREVNGIEGVIESTVSISPDGSYFAFANRENDQNYIQSVYIKTGMGFRTRIINEPRKIIISPSNRYIAFISKSNDSVIIIRIGSTEVINVRVEINEIIDLDFMTDDIIIFLTQNNKIILWTLEPSGKDDYITLDGEYINMCITIDSLILTNLEDDIFIIEFEELLNLSNEDVAETVFKTSGERIDHDLIVSSDFFIAYFTESGVLKIRDLLLGNEVPITGVGNAPSILDIAL